MDKTREEIHAVALNLAGLAMALETVVDHGPEEAAQTLAAIMTAAAVQLAEDLDPVHHRDAPTSGAQDGVNARGPAAPATCPPGRGSCHPEGPGSRRSVRSRAVSARRRSHWGKIPETARIAPTGQR